MYSDIMIDWETLGTNSDTVVLSVGAVAFNPDGDDSYDTLEDESRCYYATFDIQEQLDRGRSVTGATILWWMNQSTMARQALIRQKTTQMEHALSRIVGLAGHSVSNKYFWGNGATFDISILVDLLGMYKVAQRPAFRTLMDLRTLKRAAGSPELYIPRGEAHDALEDAKYQVLCAQEYWRRIHKLNPTEFGRPTREAHELWNRADL